MRLDYPHLSSSFVIAFQVGKNSSALILVCAEEFMFLQSIPQTIPQKFHQPELQKYQQPQRIPQNQWFPLQ